MARVKKPRKEIPDDIAAEVLVASDRTCCVCRDEHRPVQIHHIDGDPSNFARENLAVLCRDCHALTDTKLAFARNLTPDQVRLYKESWEEKVQLRLKPDNEDDQRLELQLEVLLQITLIPHTWKLHYMDLYPGKFLDVGDKATGDIWDTMVKFGEHTYSQAEWTKYLPLFSTSISKVQTELQNILSGYGEVVPARVKLEILRMNSVLKTSQSVYHMIPHLYDILGEASFKLLFRDVIHALSGLSRLSDEERKSIASGSGHPISGGLAES